MSQGRRADVNVDPVVVVDRSVLVVLIASVHQEIDPTADVVQVVSVE